MLFFGASLRVVYFSSFTRPSACVSFYFKRPGITVTGVPCKGSGGSHCVCIGNGLLLHVPLSLVTTQGSARSEGYDVIDACLSTGSAGTDVIPGCMGTGLRSSQLQAFYGTRSGSSPLLLVVKFGCPFK